MLVLFTDKQFFMSLSTLLIQELKQESEATRKILSRVPDTKNDWKPHEKSFTLARLAAHVAEMPQWAARIMETDRYDFLEHPYKSVTFETNAELMDFFQLKLNEAIAALENANDEKLMEHWTFCRGEHVITQNTRYASIRGWLFNHMIHHRGQLSVYLRLLDVPVPGIYGPSADDIIERQRAATAQQ